MSSLDPILAHLGPFMLVLFRLSGLFIFAPMIGSPVVPLRVRALTVFMFSLALYPSLPACGQAPVALDLLALAPVAFAETLIGLGIGLIAALPIYAVQLGGLVAGQQLGLGLGSIYNPALDTESDILGQVLMFMAIAIFASAGGLELAFLALARSFELVPVGAACASMGLVVGGTGHGLGDLVLGLASSGFDVALRISTPVLCIVLLETLATAFLMKTMPQLNIMSIGFATKVVLGLFILILAMGPLAELMADDIRGTCDAVIGWASGTGGPVAIPTAR